MFRAFVFGDCNQAFHLVRSVAVRGILDLRLSLTSTSGCVKIRPIGRFRYGLRARPEQVIPPLGQIPNRQTNGFFSDSRASVRSGPSFREAGTTVPGTEGTLRVAILGGAMLLAIMAGWTDYRSRRIPNWLTVSGLAVGIGINVAAAGWVGLKTSLLGAGLGLLLLLPFVLLRSVGAGDWKLAGALGAFVGAGVLVNLLLGSVFVAGVMAAALVIYKRRVRQTLRNIGYLLISLFTFRLPGSEVSLDNPQSLKVPYGVALAFTVVLYGLARISGLGLG